MSLGERRPRADLGKGAQIDVPVVPLAALRESRMPRPAATALAQRLQQRATG
ncbi:MAG TPA: hypothetical protein VGL46_01010 [Pseudonocardiaceae bacterium]